MNIKLDRFSGIAPRYAPHLLPTNMATMAENCYFEAGALRPLRSLAVASIPLIGGGTVQTIYRHDTRDGSYWLSSTDVLDLVPSPVLNDSYRRLYFTGPAQAAPQVVAEDMLDAGDVNPAASWALGLPAPSTADVILGAPSGGDPDNPESRYYVMTWVSQYGEEGPPTELIGERDGNGEVIGPLTCNQGCSIQLTRPLEPVLDATISHWNIYRTNTGSTSTALQFVAQVSILNDTYLDTIPSARLAEVLATSSWAAPPVELQGVVQLPNGALAGFTERRLCFSEQWYPHAWPVKYQRPMENDIVGLGTYGRSLLVLTNYKPYEFVGDTPATMQRQRIEDGLACVSKRSIVDLGKGIAYATPDGIMLVGPGGAQLLTEQTYTRREWEEINPASIRAWNYNGRYVAFYDNGAGTQAGFMLDLEGNLSPLDFYATAGFYEPKTGALYLVVAESPVQFDAGSNLTASWSSRPFTTTRLVNFGAAKVRADQYPVLLTIASEYDDQTYSHSYTVQDDRPFRLASGFLANTFTITIATGTNVNGLFLAETLDELTRME